MKRLIKLLPLLAIGAAVGGLMFWLAKTGEKVAETPVRAALVEAVPGGWLVPMSAVGKDSQGSYVLKIDRLRARRVGVESAPGTQEGMARVSGELGPGEAVVADAAKAVIGEAVAPMAGIPDQKLVAMVIEAGGSAIEREDLPEAVRFISPGYRDPWGYNIALLRQLLKKSFKEFSGLKIERSTPEVRVNGSEALAMLSLRVSATYRGRNNYLLGSAAEPDHVVLKLTKAAYGWKVARASGVRPLGMEEGFLRLLGREVGMPLTEDERAQADKSCLRCRQEMSRRFGPGAATPARQP
jgi:hypothetical protein